jgi:hypothetical protein
VKFDCALLIGAHGRRRGRRWSDRNRPQSTNSRSKGTTRSGPSAGVLEASHRSCGNRGALSKPASSISRPPTPQPRRGTVGERQRQSTSVVNVASSRPSREPSAT